MKCYRCEMLDYINVNSFLGCVSWGCRQKAKGGASLKNLPVVTKGLMGIVSAAELLWIVLFLAIFGWVIANYLITDFKNAEIKTLKPFETM